ncbi:MAG: MerR family transcriptional regulator, partial [Comamonas sp.]
LESQMADLQATLDEVREQEKEARTLLKKTSGKSAA